MESQSSAIFAVKTATIQYNSFAKSKLTELANKIVLDEIHNTMRKKNFSQKIIDNTYVESVDVTTGEITIVSDYESEDGFSVSEAREEGTADHKIEPVNYNVLSWIENGVRRFSKGHWVKGLPEEKIIEKTIARKSKALQKEWEKEQDKYFERMIYGSS